MNRKRCGRGPWGTTSAGSGAGRDGAGLGAPGADCGGTVCGAGGASPGGSGAEDDEPAAAGSAAALELEAPFAFPPFFLAGVFSSDAIGCSEHTPFRASSASIRRMKLDKISAA